MPELPEVETIARRLDGVATGRTITRATLHATDLYRRGSRRLGWVNGCRIDGVERIGKAILFRTAAPRGRRDRALVVHLGMTGRFVFTETASPTEKHLHGRLVFRDGMELRYIDPRRFGYVYAGIPEGLNDVLNIGPDPFQMRANRLARLLEARTAPIKSLLLDQRLISGLGNIYVDELLFLSSIHPLTPGGVASGSAREILSAARRVLRRALKWGGTTLRDYRRPDGSSGDFQKRLAVYGRQGEPCVRCGDAIARLIVAGRGTSVCPSCQRAPGRR